MSNESTKPMNNGPWQRLGQGDSTSTTGGDLENRQMNESQYLNGMLQQNGEQLLPTLNQNETNGKRNLDETIEKNHNNNNNTSNKRLKVENNEQLLLEPSTKKKKQEEDEEELMMMTGNVVSTEARVVVEAKGPCHSESRTNTKDSSSPTQDDDKENNVKGIIEPGHDAKGEEQLTTSPPPTATQEERIMTSDHQEEVGRRNLAPCLTSREVHPETTMEKKGMLHPIATIDSSKNNHAIENKKDPCHKEMVDTNIGSSFVVPSNSSTQEPSSSLSTSTTAPPGVDNASSNETSKEEESSSSTSVTPGSLNDPANVKNASRNEASRESFLSTPSAAIPGAPTDINNASSNEALKDSSLATHPIQGTLLNAFADIENASSNNEMPKVSPSSTPAAPGTLNGPSHVENASSNEATKEVSCLSMPAAAAPGALDAPDNVENSTSSNETPIIALGREVSGTMAQTSQATPSPTAATVQGMSGSFVNTVPPGTENAVVSKDIPTIVQGEAAGTKAPTSNASFASTSPTRTAGATQNSTMAGLTISQGEGSSTVFPAVQAIGVSPVAPTGVERRPQELSTLTHANGPSPPNQGTFGSSSVIPRGYTDHSTTQMPSTSASVGAPPSAMFEIQGTSSGTSNSPSVLVPAPDTAMVEASANTAGQVFGVPAAPPPPQPRAPVANAMGSGKPGRETAPVSPGVECITTFGETDVLSGRGGGTNVHPGNRIFRDLINQNRRAYLKARKNDKPAISRAIVRSIRESNGRFLKKCEKSGMWLEIGDDAAREKTSQALRQRAPEMRKLLFDSNQQKEGNPAEEQMRQQQEQQQQMFMGMANPNVAAIGATMPAAAFMNPAMFAPNPAFLASMAAANNGGMVIPNMPNIAQNAQAFQQMFNAAFLGNGGNRFPSSPQGKKPNNEGTNT